MKKYYSIASLVTILFLSFSHNVNAQADSAKAAQLKSKLITQICDCVSKSDTAKIKTIDDAQGVIMKCFMGDALSSFMDYVSASGVDVSDMNAIQAMGQKVATELAFKCPAIMQIMVSVAKDTSGYKKILESQKP